MCASLSLNEFLMESQLFHYYDGLSCLKIATVSQLKYVEDSDLTHLGMTKPEIRRLRKYFHKYYPQTYLKKIKKMILTRNRDECESPVTFYHPMDASLVSSQSSSPSITCQSSNMSSYGGKEPSRHIISVDSIIINKELGVGEFGVVQQGVWTNEDGDRIQVAIKCLSAERMENNQLEFLKEATIMHSISHEHIVRLYGVVLEPSLMLVTELAPLRSLLECLKEPALRNSFPIISLCNFAAQIADGMSYLESKRLIHRDLAARNILVFAKNKVKISDFGLSRALGVGKDYYQTNFNVNLKLPIAWCAPECINYLKFTSQSDVWAYGVTLWEMFSYGFQPWAALTGQQILESIDEPSYQRLEPPECCPKEYYSLMLKCWAHDPNARPKFVDIVTLLPECKPELVQAVKESDDTRHSTASKSKKEFLNYKIGDVITVLDKKGNANSSTAASSPFGSSCSGLSGVSHDVGSICTTLWKGALNNGRVGYFNPSHVVAYLGQNLPTSLSSSVPSSASSTSSSSTLTSTVLHSNFIRGILDSRHSNASSSPSLYSSRRRLRPDMISRPQGDLKHTGHVGADGAFFGDIAFLGDKYQQLPKQIVTPYHDSPKPSVDLMDKPKKKDNGGRHRSSNAQLQHEYHEISDDDEIGASLESPPFETFDFGPSLMDEVFKELEQIKPDFSNEINDAELAINESGTNVKNEIKEITSKMRDTVALASSVSSKKKQAMVKPISAADQLQLDSAIAMAKDIASRSMLALDSGDVIDGGSETSPKTPNSPNKRKFSFKFSTSKASPKSERRNFSEETESIGHITESITPAAKEAYSTLVDKGEGLTEHTHGDDNDMTEGDNDGNPLRMLRSVGAMGLMRSRVRGNRSFSQPRLPTTAQTAGLARVASCASRSNLGAPPPVPIGNTCDDSNNALPLPPRDRSRPLPVLKTHQRRHPLVLPSSITNGSESQDSALYLRRDSSPAALSSVKPVLKHVSCPQAPLQFLQSNYNAVSAAQNQLVNDDVMAINTSKKTAPIPPPKPLRTFQSDNENLLTDIESTLDCKRSNIKTDDLSQNNTVKSSRESDDSVRVMQKVLQNEVDLSYEEATAILRTTDWDVHRAIKCIRLRQQLRSHNIDKEYEWAKVLAKFNWNVRHAVNHVMSSQESHETSEMICK